MKPKLLSIVVLLLFSINLLAQTNPAEESSDTVLVNKVEKMILNLRTLYPMIEIYDVYKSVFQDVMGPEHMITDSISARKYLDAELKMTNANGCIPAYVEPCGIDGTFVRVYLNAVTDGLITEDDLTNAFIHSSQNCNIQKIELLKKEWYAVKKALKKTPLYNVQFKPETQENFIDSILNTEDVSIHHSKTYSREYSPHYRVISMNVYDKYLKSKIYGDDSTDVYPIESVDVSPSYPGGIDSLREDLCKNWGENEPILQQWHGMWITIVQVMVEKDGSLTNPEIIRYHDKIFDHHALGAVKHLKNFSPAIKDGNAVRCKIAIRVRYPNN